MSTKTKTSAATGVRYSDAQKKEVVDFVSQYNSKNGRGGQSAASEKFKVTPLTIAAWMKAAGAPATVKAAKAAKPAKVVKSAKAAKPAKAAKAPKAAGKVGRGSRYTPEQKQEIIDYVNAYNATHGRGGQSKAVQKYKLSAITCASWLKGAGVKSEQRATKSTPAPTAKQAKAAAPNGLAGKVASLVELNEQVRKAEIELERLYAKHDSMMASIKNW